MPTRAFNLRRFVTFVVVLSFAAAGGSGLVLFLRPEGSIARWVGWSALGLDKRQWEAAHITFTVALVVSSLAHLCYNWRALVSYLKRKGPLGPLAPSLELAGALLLVAVVGVGTLTGRQPFSALLGLRSDVKDGRFAVVTPPPVADADHLTVVEVSRSTSLPEQRIVDNARQQGITIRDVSATIGSIAREHRRSPQEVYKAMLGASDGRLARP